MSVVSGEPDKAETNGEHVATAPLVTSEAEPVSSVVTAPEPVSTPVPTIDKLMEEDKKKELLKAVDIDSGSTEASSAINGAKKGIGLVDYNDSDDDEGKDRGGGDVDADSGMETIFSKFPKNAK